MAGPVPAGAADRTYTVYLVVWVDTGGVTHTEQADARDTADQRVRDLRARADVYRAGWDAIDPFDGSTGEAM